MTANAQIDYAAFDDVALARLCVSRDRQAQRYLITSNNQRLFRAAWSILRDKGEAEDALQAGYLKAFSALDKFEGRSSLSTWLTRIVINEAIGRLRAQRQRREQLEGEGVAMIETYRDRFGPASAVHAPDVDLAREQLRLLIERAVADLPDIFRSVFVLREIEGLSVEDTAEVLEIPAATVKTRLHRARSKLQQALAPDVQGALTGSFPFAGADCLQLTARVMADLP